LNSAPSRGKTSRFGRRELHLSQTKEHIMHSSIRSVRNEALETRVLFAGVPPQLIEGDFRFDEPRQQVRAEFNADVAPSVTASDLVLVNLTTGQTIPTNVIAIVPDESGDHVSFEFPGLRNGILPDGNYRAIFPAGSVQDPGGNALAADAHFDFFVLAGDANRDRVVDTIDFNILAGNFGRSDRPFSHANFDYLGRVDTLDFNILAAQFGKTLPPPATTAAISPDAAPSPSPFAHAGAIGATDLTGEINSVADVIVAAT
jgi:hypothetical protein